MAVNEQLIYPDAVRGFCSLLDGADILGNKIAARVIVPLDYASSDETVVHISRMSTNEGAVDRTEEVRMVVYGPSVFESTDVAEAILSIITGDLIVTPESDYSAEFLFDWVRQRTGPAPVDYPNENVIPVAATFAACARPINF